MNLNGDCFCKLRPRGQSSIVMCKAAFTVIGSKIKIQYSTKEQEKLLGKAIFYIHGVKELLIPLTQTRIEPDAQLQQKKEHVVDYLLA